VLCEKFAMRKNLALAALLIVMPTLFLCSSPASSRINYRARRFFFEGKVLTISHNQLVVRGLDKDKKMTTISFVLSADAEFKIPRESLREGDSVNVDYDYTLDANVYRACVVSQVKAPAKGKKARKRSS
jgi:hypothetical protein